MHFTGRLALSIKIKVARWLVASSTMLKLFSFNIVIDQQLMNDHMWEGTWCVCREDRLWDCLRLETLILA